MAFYYFWQSFFCVHEGTNLLYINPLLLLFLAFILNADLLLPSTQQQQHKRTLRSRSKNFSLNLHWHEVTTLFCCLQI